MVELGYALSSEEHSPNELVENARMAEDTGFTFALISDHIHRWVDRQRNSAFVRSVSPDQAGFFRFYEREVMPRLRVASEERAGAR
jgi:alkanesulfonate monooxygenase SsuD/methylene tetrahydromethanopterin reductase-like flavin-dependent oxidoreductase (luciferase family)